MEFLTKKTKKLKYRKHADEADETLSKKFELDSAISAKPLATAVLLLLIF